MGDEIVVVPYDPTWPEVFERERETILREVPAIRVLHLGSTSVSGLASKPIIDIFLTVGMMEDAEDMMPPLESMGYERVDIGEAGRVFLKKGVPRSHHLHIVREGGEELRRHVAFRDALIEDPFKRDAYASLKIRLAERYRYDRQGYCESKAAFIEDVLKDVLGPRRG